MRTAQYNHLSLINGYIMDVSKGSYVCIKRTDVFYTFMDKPTRTLVSARCKSLMNVFALSFKFEPKPENSKKLKSLDTLKFKK